MPTLVAPVAGAIAQFDSWNIDGESNARRSHGDTVKYWKNGGSAANDATPVLGTIYSRPLLKKNDDEQSVALDGIIDGLLIPSSDADFKFIHETAIFDLYLCFRLRQYNKPLFGCTTQSSTGKGLSIFVGSDGALTISIGNGTSNVVLAQSYEMRLPLFEPTKLLVRGTGAAIKVSQNFFDFETAAISNPLPTGNAVSTYVIGERLTTDTVLAHADFFWLSLYNSNLNQASLDIMASCIQSRAGSQA